MRIGVFLVTLTALALMTLRASTQNTLSIGVNEAY